MPLPPHPPNHKPPHVRERTSLVKSLIISTGIAIIFYFIMDYLNVPLGGSVPASVALWTGLVAILTKLLAKHP